MAVNAAVAGFLLAPSRAALVRLAGIGVGLWVCSWGLWLFRPELAVPKHTVRIVQPNIPLDQPWDPESKTTALLELERLSRGKPSDPSLEAGSTQLILWPETPAPFYFNHDREFRWKAKQIASSTGSYFLFGFVDFRSSQNGSHRAPYNSVALLSPQAETVSQYDKIHLVPFGEYVPYARIFFFVEKISTEAGNFSAGDRIVVSPIGNEHSLASFICYEAVVPDLVRQFARNGAQVFVNVTNDAWFGESAAPFQHLAMARMRAIENRRYLLRAANNGISAVISPFGRVVASVLRNQRTAFESFFAFEARLTPYTRWGDWLVWMSLLVSGILMIRNCVGGGHLLRGEKPEVK
jgi:apolipoprotein N-acyltransferase